MAATVGATLSGVTFPLRHAGLGPYKSSAGNFYFFGRDSVNTGHIEPHKASDPTSSFTAQTTKLMSSGNTTAIEAACCYQQGDTVYVFTQISTGAVYHNRFDMATDAWGIETSATTIAAASQAPTTGSTFVSAVYRPTAGELVLVYNAGQTAMSSTFNMVRYARVNASTGAVIGSATNVDNGGSVNWTGPVAVLGASDRVHFFFVASGSANSYQRTLSAANALETFPSPYLSATGGSVLHDHNAGVSYVDGATTRVRVPIRQVSGGSYLNAVAKLDSADAPTVTTELASDGVARTANNQVVHALANDGTSLHLLYGATSDSDLYYDKQTGSGWGTDTNELAATINAISVPPSVYTRGGSTVLPMVVDNGGTIKYAEIALAAPPAATSFLFNQRFQTMRPLLMR